MMYENFDAFLEAMAETWCDYHKDCSLCAFDKDDAGNFVCAGICQSNVKKHLSLMRAKDINVPATLPAWCKVGRLVFHNSCLLGKIEGFEEVSEEGSTHPTTYVVLRSYERHNKLSFTRLPKQIQPVRFRPYTYEEAKKLLGKVMEVPEKEGFCGIDLICSVSFDRESGDVLINGGCFEGLSKDGCLIDGVPIGVPEVDEEALKGGEEGDEE